MADYDLITSLLLEQKNIAADNPYLNFASSLPQMQPSKDAGQNALAQTLAGFTQNFAQGYGKKQVKQEQEDLAKGVAAALTSENPQEKLKEVSPTLASAYELQVAQAKQKQQELAQKMGLDLQKYQMQQDYSHDLQRQRMAEQAGYSAQLKAMPGAPREQVPWSRPEVPGILTDIQVMGGIAKLPKEKQDLLNTLSPNEYDRVLAAARQGSTSSNRDFQKTEAQIKREQDMFKAADNEFYKLPATKEATTMLSAVQRGKDLLAQGNSISHGAMLSVFSEGVSGEGGVKSKDDIDRIKDPTLKAKLMGVSNFLFGGTDTPVTEPQMKAYLDAFNAMDIAAQNSINKARSEVYGSMRRRYKASLDPESSAALENHVFETLGSSSMPSTYNPTGDQGGVTPAATQPGIAEITQFRQANPNATPEEIRAKAIELGIPLR